MTPTVPGAEDRGTTTEIDVVEFTVTAALVSVSEPKVTTAPVVKCIPVIVTVSPPVRGDESGVIDMMTGIGLMVVRITISAEVAPSAMHALVEAQSTPLRSLTPEGRVSCVQAVPLKESTTPAMPPVEVMPCPTAWQDVAEIQETPLRSLTPEGRVFCVQAVPLKERATPVVLPVEVMPCPTAWQDVAEIQETPLRSLTPEGRVFCVQAVPLKERATPVVLPVEVEEVPTAWQEVAETQEMLLRPPTPEGRVSCVQAVPLKERATPVVTVIGESNTSRSTPCR
ncbi:MAG: hypothetical protein M1420_03590 [Actinobacteria bacterium]|nr:hypothetical protein [Actinomycetota bacterium]